MRHPTIKLLLDALLAVSIVLVGFLIAGAVAPSFVRGQVEPAPAVDIKLWRLEDPADPVLAAAAVEAPAFLLELGFKAALWPVKNHQIEGLTRQVAGLCQREWKIGLPIISRAFVDHGAGEEPFIFPGGAAGLVLRPEGFSFLYLGN